MTSTQAIDLREHLTKQLNENSFSDIVTEVNIRLEENYDESEFEKNPTGLLIFFPPLQVFQIKQHAVVGVFFHRPHEIRKPYSTNIYYRSVAGEGKNTPPHGVKIKFAT
ncbi:MAG: hypothetical protein HOP10_14850 [Chitinophagaceae bacterium]|nr:hypothetical protein [Chitinophagaceae bacterium]